MTGNRVVQTIGILLILMMPSIGISQKAAVNGQVLAAVKKDGKWGFIDTLGKTAIPFTMDAANGFSEGLAAVKYGTEWGFINKKGQFSIKPVFTKANGFHDGHALISFIEKRDNQSYTGYISRFGTMSILLENYETGSDFHDGLAQIVSLDINGRAVGYKDSLDKWMIKPHYDDATDFNEGKAAVALGKLWGFINDENKIVVFPEYDEAWSYQEGFAYVKSGNKTSFLNSKGKVAFTVIHDETDLAVQEGLICFKDNGLIGYISLDLSSR